MNAKTVYTGHENASNFPITKKGNKKTSQNYQPAITGKNSQVFT